MDNDETTGMIDSSMYLCSLLWYQLLDLEYFVNSAVHDEWMNL